MKFSIKDFFIFCAVGILDSPEKTLNPSSIGRTAIFWSEHVKVWMLHSDWLNVARDIIVSFCFFS